MKLIKQLVIKMPCLHADCDCPYDPVEVLRELEVITRRKLASNFGTAKPLNNWARKGEAPTRTHDGAQYHELFRCGHRRGFG